MILRVVFTGCHQNGLNLDKPKVKFIYHKVKQTLHCIAILFKNCIADILCQGPPKANSKPINEPVPMIVNTCVNLATMDIQ